MTKVRQLRVRDPRAGVSQTTSETKLGTRLPERLEVRDPSTSPRAPRRRVPAPMGGAGHLAKTMRTLLSHRYYYTLYFNESFSTVPALQDRVYQTLIFIVG